MDWKTINIIDVQNRAKSVGLKLNLTSNLFENFDLDQMDDLQHWIWTGEGDQPTRRQSKPRISDLLDIRDFLNNTTPQTA